MAEFKTITPEFSVAPQLGAEDIARAADEGYAAIIANRPDGEAPGQLTLAQAEAAAKAAGLKFHAIPYSMPLTPAIVAETAAALEQIGAGRVLAYCRTGTRSVTAWAMAQVAAGALTPDQAIGLAERAGYDLSGARGVLDRLSAG
ncbi:MAG: TIGR01244 family sulfur transferase [Hyphomonadaceae bacterium]